MWSDSYRCIRWKISLILIRDVFNQFDLLTQTTADWMAYIKLKFNSLTSVG